MKKISYKFFIISIIVSISFFSSPLIFNNKVFAVDQIIVSTTGYSALSSNVVILGGAYSGNTQKKPFTTYFEYKKDSSDLDTDAEETIKIVRNSNVAESNDFYSSPELKLFSTYYFRAVGYFNDTPETKFYGSVLSLSTGSIPYGASTYPFAIGENNNVVPYVSPVVDGAWSTWSAWNACSVTACGQTGTQTSMRVCTPAQNDGTPCSAIDGGKASDVQSCSTAVCTGTVTGTCTITVTLDGTNNPPQHLTQAACFDLQNTGVFTTEWTEDQAIPPDPSNPPSSTGLVKCGIEKNTDGTIKSPCGFNDFLKLINAVVKFILYDLALPITAIMFAYAGFLLVTSGGSTENRGKAKKIFTNAAFGFIIALAAFLIIKTILSIVGYSDTWTGF